VSRPLRHSSTKPQQDVSRREFLKHSAEVAVVLPIAEGHAVFAQLFFTAPHSVRIEPGYYDPASQLYISQETGHAAFVSSGECTERAHSTIKTCTISSMTGTSDHRIHRMIPSRTALRSTTRPVRGIFEEAIACGTSHTLLRTSL